MYNRNYGGFDYVRIHSVIAKFGSKPNIFANLPVTAVIRDRQPQYENRTMKKILGAILITFLVSCNSNSKTEKQLLEKENELLQRELELTKKEQNSDSKEVEISNPK